VAEITLDGLTKIYPDGTRAVHDLDLKIADGEFVVLVGPSGCGKTSALRMIAGLEDITSGTVRVDGEVVNGLPPKARDMAMIFQNYALYPHMNVEENIGFGLKMRGVDRAEIRRRVEEAARILGITEVLVKRPRHLSGGQRQRVAMGRAIVREPKAFLMDEPLSNLDAQLRVQMRAEIARIQRDLQVTTVYVTHDQSEALTLGDRVCVMRGGLLQQIDRPQVLYERPANLFVAGFIGSPAMNFVEATLVEHQGRLSAEFGPHSLDAHPDTFETRPGLRSYVGQRVALGIRPEDIHDPLGEPIPPGRGIEVRAEIREDMGSDVYLHFSIDAPPVTAVALQEVVGEEALAAAEEQTHHHGSPFIARVTRESAAREDQSVTLSVATKMLHFFDLETGREIRAALPVAAPESLKRQDPDLAPAHERA
jgi:multiple sugar transport system ATP-binding protein